MAAGRGVSADITKNKWPARRVIQHVATMNDTVKAALVLRDKDVSTNRTKIEVVEDRLAKVLPLPMAHRFAQGLDSRRGADAMPCYQGREDARADVLGMPCPGFY